MSVVVCEGCGRVAGEREAYCGACGRPLPGRSAAQSDAAPPGWLVAPTPRDQAGPWFEPMPSVPMPLADVIEPSAARAVSRGAPTYRVVERQSTDGPPAPPPPPLPLAGAERAAAGAAAIA
jgi:hypothetical protein